MGLQKQKVNGSFPKSKTNAKKHGETNMNDYENPAWNNRGLNEKIGEKSRKIGKGKDGTIRVRTLNTVSFNTSLT